MVKIVNLMYPFSAEIYGRILPELSYSINQQLDQLIDVSYLDSDILSYQNFRNEQFTRSQVKSGLSAKDYAQFLLEKEAKHKAKWSAIKERRRYFASHRARLTLTLLNSGVDYICAHPNCQEYEDLTIDHKIPLSRGGSDELDNLQFLCRSHNSLKHDKIEGETE